MPTAEAHADLSYPILGGEEAVPSWVAGGRRRRPRREQCEWVKEEKHGQLAAHNAKSWRQSFGCWRREYGPLSVRGLLLFFYAAVAGDAVAAGLRRYNTATEQNDTVLNSGSHSGFYRHLDLRNLKIFYGNPEVVKELIKFLTGVLIYRFVKKLIIWLEFVPIDEINFRTLCIWTKKNRTLKSLNAWHWRHCEWWLKQQSVGLHLFGKQWRHTNFPTIHRSPLHVLLLFLRLQHSAATRKCCLRPLHVVQRDKNLSEFLFYSLKRFQDIFFKHFQC